MELRVLGAHNMESLSTRMEGHLIDGVLALDAGGLTRALTFEEQRGIRAVILSHRHFDHVRDILPLGLFIRGKDVTTRKCSTTELHGHPICQIAGAGNGTRTRDIQLGRLTL